MRKFVVIAVLAVAFWPGPGTAGAGTIPTPRNNPDAKYFFGTGGARGSDVSFVVSEGKVRKILMGTGRTRCERGKTSIFKAFLGIEIDGHAFRRQVSPDRDRFLFAGRIHGAEARGRMELRLHSDRYGGCASGRITWTARRVSHAEWKKHRHGYQTLPH